MLGISATSAWLLHALASSLSLTGWNTLKIGAGGLITGISIANDGTGTKVIRTDTWGAYVSSNGNKTWQQLVTMSSMPAGYSGIANGNVSGGVCEIVIAPSNSQYMYMYWGAALGTSGPSFIFYSTNGGTTWSVGLTITGCYSLDQIYKTTGPIMAVDPINPSVVLVGAQGGGLYISSNNGVSWTAIPNSTVPYQVTITGITNAASAVVTYSGTPQPFQTATDYVYITGVAGMTQINGINTNSSPSVTATGSGTVTLNVNSSGFSAYSSGGTMATRSGIPIAFDPSSAQVGGKTQGIYALPYGFGLYHSGDGGTTWAAVGGSGTAPTTAQSISVGSDGYVYLNSFGFAQSIFVYNPNTTTWTNPTVGTASQTVTGVAADPGTVGRIVVFGHGFQSISTNHGVTWTGWTTNPPTRTALDVPWLGYTNESFMSSCHGAFDPSQSNVLYAVEGVGVWTCSPVNANANLAYTSQSAGIEQLVATQVKAPGFATNNVIVTAWDRPIFKSADPTVYPSKHGVNNTNAIVRGADFDFAQGAPQNIAVIANWSGGGPVAETSGVSTDGGSTWSVFGAFPTSSSTDYGGCIACKDANHILWLPTQQANPWYTTNGGTSWTEITNITGVDSTSGHYKGWFGVQQQTTNRVVACVDAAGTYYLYNAGNGVSNIGGTTSQAGIYKSTDGGATWAGGDNVNGFQGNLTGNDGFSVKLRAVPGNAANLAYTVGHQSTPNFGAMKRSLDGGVTWTTVPNVAGAIDIGFGVSFGGPSGYPACYIVGWVSGTYGIWRSDNFNAASVNSITWVSHDAAALHPGYPNDSFDAIQCIAGDPATYGRIYVGFGGSGWAYWHP